MRARTARLAAGCSVLGAVLWLVAAIPPEWYGATEGTSYVFDPPAFSPLWFERNVVPLLTLVAGALFVVAVGALVYRDLDVAGPLRRYGGYVAVAGLVVFEVAQLILTWAGSSLNSGTNDLQGAVVALVGLVILLVALALLLVGFLALGSGLYRADRRVVGAALVVAPFLAGFLFWLDSPLEGLVDVTPALLAFGAVGVELWTHPGPAPAPDSGEPTGGPGSGSVGDASDEPVDDSVEEEPHPSDDSGVPDPSVDPPEGQRIGDETGTDDATGGETGGDEGTVDDPGGGDVADTGDPADDPGENGTTEDDSGRDDPAGNDAGSDDPIG